MKKLRLKKEIIQNLDMLKIRGGDNTATCTVIGDSGGTNCGSCTTCPTRQIVCPTRQEDCPTKVNCQTKLFATCQCDMESVNKKCDGVVIEPSW